MPDFYGSYGFNERTCPRCGKSDVGWGGCSTTLVGWSGGEDQNPNHWTQSADCRACGLHFTREWVIRDKNAWCAVAIDEGAVVYGHPIKTMYVIAGHPSCCESTYKLMCACGSWTQNRQLHKAVSSRAGPDGKWVSNPPHIWDCPSCGYSSEKQPEAKKLERPTSWQKVMED